MSQLRKLIVLTPEQLQRLQGRDHALTTRYDVERQRALQQASKEAKQVGPTQAYVQYRAAQQRHLHHASQERSEPLQIEISEPHIDPKKEEPKFEEIKFKESKVEQPKIEKPKASKKAKREAKSETKIPKAVSSVKSGRVVKNVARVAPRVQVSPLKTRGARNRERFHELKPEELKWLEFNAR